VLLIGEAAGNRDFREACTVSPRRRLGVLYSALHQILMWRLTDARAEWRAKWLGSGRRRRKSPAGRLTVEIGLHEFDSLTEATSPSSSDSVTGRAGTAEEYCRIRPQRTARAR